MKYKLSIITTTYSEPTEVLLPLLDSIALQQRIDFSTIEVIIVNDGGTFEISDEKLKSYPFDTRFIRAEHKGVSATRNRGIDEAQGEYVCICDCDDMFYNMCGLWIIEREIDNGEFDSMVSVFVEESRIIDKDGNRGDYTFINHNMDSTFVHGKVHRKAYLDEQKIRFNPKLQIHEDSFFNILAQNCTDQTRVKFCQTPFYLWKWRDESVCRHDPKYILKTYNNMLDSNSALIDEFIKRQKMDKAGFYTCFMIWDAYYSLNKPEWLDINNQEYRDNVEKHFADYFRKHKDIWNEVPQQDKMFVSNMVRGRSIQEGMLMESITINEWLNKIAKKYK